MLNIVLDFPHSNANTIAPNENVFLYTNALQKHRFVYVLVAGIVTINLVSILSDQLASWRLVFPDTYRVITPHRVKR